MISHSAPRPSTTLTLTPGGQAETIALAMAAMSGDTRAPCGDRARVQIAATGWCPRARHTRTMPRSAVTYWDSSTTLIDAPVSTGEPPPMSACTAGHAPVHFRYDLVD